MTIKETAAIMDILKIAYPRFFVGADAPDPKKTLSLWATMFDGDPVEDVAMAVKAYIATDTKGFPPAIGAIKEAIVKSKMSGELSESEAWALVRRAVSNGYYHAGEEFAALPPLVQKVVGGPSQLRDWAILEDGLDTVVASNFMRSYRAKLENQKYVLALPDSIRGRYEALVEKVMPQLTGGSEK